MNKEVVPMARSSIGRLGKSFAKTVLQNTPQGATIFSIRESGIAYKTAFMTRFELYKTLPETSFEDKKKFSDDFCNRVSNLNKGY